MLSSINVHLTFLNFSQRHLVRNHWFRGCGLLFGFCAEDLFLACVKMSWGIPSLQMNLGKIFLQNTFDHGNKMINCSIVLVVLPPQALPHIYPPALKLPVYLLLIYNFLTFYSCAIGSCVVQGETNHL
jgi:hypothetical protein